MESCLYDNRKAVGTSMFAFYPLVIFFLVINRIFFGRVLDTMQRTLLSVKARVEERWRMVKKDSQRGQE